MLVDNMCRIATTSSMICGLTVATWYVWNALWCLATQHTLLSPRRLVDMYIRRRDTANQSVQPPAVRFIEQQRPWKPLTSC